MTEQTPCEGCHQVPNGPGETGEWKKWSDDTHAHILFETFPDGSPNWNICPGPPRATENATGGRSPVMVPSVFGTAPPPQADAEGLLSDEELLRVLGLLARGVTNPDVERILPTIRVLQERLRVAENVNNMSGRKANAEGSLSDEEIDGWEARHNDSMTVWSDDSIGRFLKTIRVLQEELEKAERESKLILRLVKKELSPHLFWIADAHTAVINLRGAKRLAERQRDDLRLAADGLGIERDQADAENLALKSELGRVGRERDEVREANVGLLRDALEAQAQLRNLIGCPSCNEDHPPQSTCPPHEIRGTGLDSIRPIEWRSRYRGVEAQLAALREACIHPYGNHREQCSVCGGIWPVGEPENHSIAIRDRPACPLSQPNPADGMVLVDEKQLKIMRSEYEAACLLGGFLGELRGKPIEGLTACHEAVSEITHLRDSNEKMAAVIAFAQHLSGCAEWNAFRTCDCGLNVARNKLADFKAGVIEPEAALAAKEPADA